MGERTILLSAGGTGGHLFPAEALAHEMTQRGWSVHLATDQRAERYAGGFPAVAVHSVPSATFGSRNPFAMAHSGWTLWRGFVRSSSILQRLKPAIVVGFGGYPTLPPLFAATRRNIPTLIHEQNAVMGRANRALAARVTAIAGGFMAQGEGDAADKMVVTGNPVRPAVIEAAKSAYPSFNGEKPFRLLVFGGSQGAQFFSEAVPPAIGALPEEARARIAVTQQARPEDEAAVRAAYAEMGVAAEVSPFFTDLAQRMAAAHLVVSRSGASTVSEIAVIGRPALLVPYPHALDHDQAANAAALQAKGGAQVIAQKDLDPAKLSRLLADAMNDPDRLARTAAGAKAAGKPDASALLASLVEAIAGGTPISQIKSKREDTHS
jgi:UDP-N-acetylglucosamine--N-acetylmuramyl-(pentapeptide) pyrophosphoryl-undecaprenol N-acetylglucosamine transferase